MEEAQVPEWTDEQRRRKWDWAGHISRSPRVHDARDDRARDGRTALMTSMSVTSARELGRISGLSSLRTALVGAPCGRRLPFLGRDWVTEDAWTCRWSLWRPRLPCVVIHAVELF